jgi:hypothetical protein
MWCLTYCAKEGSFNFSVATVKRSSMDSGIKIHLPLNLLPFSNIVMVSLCIEEERGEVREGKEGREGRERERAWKEERVDLGDPGGEEFGELLLSDLLALFLYFLFRFLFFFVAEESWEEDWVSERLDSDCVQDLLRGRKSLMVVGIVACGVVLLFLFHIFSRIYFAKNK